MTGMWMLSHNHFNHARVARGNNLKVLLLSFRPDLLQAKECLWQGG